MDEVLGNLKTKSIHALLNDLPIGVKDMHTTLFAENSIRSGLSRDLQVLIFHWVTHLYRPLRLLEIAAGIQLVSLGNGRSAIRGTKEMVRFVCGLLPKHQYWHPTGLVYPADTS